MPETNGDEFVGSSTSAKMPHPGDVEGGNDRMRGGNGEDSLHAGFGDDLANGDSGGDAVFGDDGADVIWGGRGCDQSIDTQAVSPDCYTNGVFDQNAPAHPDQKATCASADWPEAFGNGSKNNPIVTVDPCLWFVMTSHDISEAASQHHQGIDWQYGGWDRDVLQADVADTGPNDGDRLLDWTGAYNLYTHCNSAYGGYNDVRQHSPDWQNFLQQWVFSLGAGQVASDSANGSAGVGTSAFDELALVYPGTDNDHGSGSAFPSTPGHFDNPNACAP